MSLSALNQWIATLPADQQAAAQANIQAEVESRAQVIAAEQVAVMTMTIDDGSSSSPPPGSSTHTVPPTMPPAPATMPLNGMTSGSHHHATVMPQVYAVRPSPPEHFSGDRSKVEEFIDQLQRFISLTNIALMEPATQVQQAVLLLKGEALTWYRSTNMANPIVSIDDLVSRMRSYFLPYGYDKLARSKLRSLTQQTTVQVYNALFMRTMQHITDMSPVDQLDNYITGLKGHIKAHLWTKEPKSLHEAMTEAALAESRFQHFNIVMRGYRGVSASRGASYASSSYAQMHPRTAGAPPSAASNAATSTSTTSDPMDLSHIESELNAVQQGQRLGKLSDADRAKLRAEGRCFRCREKGHISAQCPKNGQSQ